MPAMTESIHAPIKILTVDDIASNLAALDAVLARPDVELVHANSGPQALELLLDHDFGLAILDVNMPGMDGFELAELMRGSTRTSHIPILFLTAAGYDSQRTFKGYASGAVDFLYKPLDANILAAKVDVFVQLARQKQQLADQLTTTRRLLKANEMLMAVLAHDLRTPLSAILASASFLERFGKDDKLAPSIDRIRRSGTRMVRMVDQLLDVARLHGGRMQPTLQREDLHGLCAAIVDEHESRHGKGRLVLERQGETAAMVDPGLMSQVLSNLIGNALQHGDSAVPVTIRVDGSGSGRVKVCVHNGGAIPAELLPHLFDPFRSGRSAAESEGLGLGLHIARELALLHGGDIKVTSDAERGTEFVLHIPR